MERMERKPKLHQHQHSEITNDAGLPLDLIIDILSRLPAKFICQFRCVSKLWRAILSPPDPVLQNLHRNRSNSTPLLLFFYNSYHYIFFSSLDTQGQLQNWFTKQIGSPVQSRRFCQGLMCLLCSEHVYVCNPSTQELLQVPYSSKLCDIYDFALGFLPSTNEYKIAHWFLERDRNLDMVMVCQLFTIKGGPNSHGTWRVVGNSPHFLSVRRHPICVNGSFYWLVNGLRNSGNSMKILAFDLATEEYETVLCPKTYSGRYDDTDQLLSIEGSLCLVYGKQGEPHIDIWMMKDRKNQIWTKEYSFDIFATNRPLWILQYIPSGDGRDEEMLIWSQKGCLLFYNIKTRCIRNMGNLINKNIGIDFDMGVHLWPHLYFDSLYSLGAR
ncbi:unnamed protein product [Ilex paraguariensis]|uniref:F-box domain-containing protein n=1 Tax=Ilex paraguariensis TaxID=185542 RepID=A0ABC8QTC3_9AQUA